MGKQSESSFLLLRGGKGENPSECCFWPIRSTLDWAVLYSEDRDSSREGRAFPIQNEERMEYGKECMRFRVHSGKHSGSIPSH